MLLIRHLLSFQVGVVLAETNGAWIGDNLGFFVLLDIKDAAVHAGLLRLVTLLTTTDPSKHVSSRLKRRFITSSPVAVTQPAMDAVEPVFPLVSLTCKGSVPSACKPYNEWDLYYAAQCRQYCVDGTRTSKTQRFRLSSFSYVRSSQQEIRKALHTGPLIAGMTLYSDLIKYKGGIYSPTYGHREGKHVVELVGYGRENGVDYWILCKNSWGTKWGENGYFRIRAGERQSEIESHGIILSPFSSTSRILSKREQHPSFFVGVSIAANVESEDIIEAAQFASYELNPFCPDVDVVNERSDSLTFLRVNRASRKPIAGEELNMIATYQVAGCPVTIHPTK